MANEAVLRHRRSDPIDFIVADATGIEKGTVCALSGARTAAANSANGDIFAGVARREKIASDGRTRLALFTDGIFDMHCGEAVTAGAQVTLSGANSIRPSIAGDLLNGLAFGKALETGTDGATIQVSIGGKA